MSSLLDAVKLAYRKHHLGDDSIGWDELSNCLLDALCNELGDDGYQQWLASQQPYSADPGVSHKSDEFLWGCNCKHTA